MKVMVPVWEDREVGEGEENLCQHLRVSSQPEHTNCLKSVSGFATVRSSMLLHLYYVELFPFPKVVVIYCNCMSWFYLEHFS